MSVLVLVRRTCSRRIPFRHYSTTSSLPELPPEDKWRVKYPFMAKGRRERVTVKNAHTAKLLANAFLPQSNPDGEGKVVIEAFPGPGALSRAMLELPSSKLRKLIILEEDEVFLKSLRPLEADPRVTIIPMSGHTWDTYTHLEDLGMLDDVETGSWETSIPNLHFVAHLPHSIKGEQLIAQLYRSIPERQWLFRHGRMPMSFVLSDWVYSRICAAPGDSRRCKLSVIADASAETTEVVDLSDLSPYEKHFYPPASGLAATARQNNSRRVGQPIRAITSVPYSEQIIKKGMTDKWDFCLRRLFVLKSTPLQGAINSLAPGATSLLKELTDASVPLKERVNVLKRPRDMTVADWTLLLRAFDHWPFAPQDLMITDAFANDID